MNVCMNALRDVSKVWLVAKMVHTLFESILGNKMLEERLQKAPGKRHKKARIDRHPAAEKENQQKRKFEMDLGFSNGPPAPQVSYERSRPQTPALTPSREMGQSGPVPMAAPSTSPPVLRQPGDNHMAHSNSRNNTRPPTPFNPSFSVPATPPDLYLVTRNSPPISQSLWENFQPDQLFPGGTDLSFPQYPSNQANLDPQLQQIQAMQTPQLQQPQLHGQQQQQLPQRSLRGSADSQAGMQGMHQMANLQQVPNMQQHNSNHWPNQFQPDGHSPDDNWSNSSRGVVPATLNVEDW